MAIVTRKPRNSSLRFQTYLDTSDITTKAPEKDLTIGLRKTGGRNAYGRITMRHLVVVLLENIESLILKEIIVMFLVKLATIEYDPNRNVRIGLVVYANGAKHYMLMPEGLRLVLR